MPDTHRPSPPPGLTAPAVPPGTAPPRCLPAGHGLPRAEWRRSGEDPGIWRCAYGELGTLMLVTRPVSEAHARPRHDVLGLPMDPWQGPTMLMAWTDGSRLRLMRSMRIPAAFPAGTGSTLSEEAALAFDAVAGLWLRLSSECPGEDAGRLAAERLGAACRECGEHLSWNADPAPSSRRRVQDDAPGTRCLPLR